MSHQIFNPESQITPLDAFHVIQMLSHLVYLGGMESLFLLQ